MLSSGYLAATLLSFLAMPTPAAICVQMYAPSEQQLVISLISRKPGSWSSRALVNEQELIEAMQQRWPTANVSLLHFESLPSKTEAMLAVGRTNVLIGVHGAGEPCCWSSLVLLCAWLGSGHAL